MAKVRGVEIRNDVKEVLDTRPKIQFMADKILPVIQQNVTGGEVFVMGAGEGKKKFDTRRAPDGTYNSGSWRLKKEIFSTSEHGFEERVDLMEEMVMADILDERTASGEMALDALLIDRESRVSSEVFNATTFAGIDYSATVSDAWNLPTADIKDDIRGAANEIKKRMGIGQKNLSLIVNDDLIDYMIDVISSKGNISNNIALELENDKTRLAAITRYLNVKEIVAVSSLYDVSGLDTDGSAEFQDMWRSDFAMLASLSPTTNSWKAGGLGRQPNYTKLTKDYLVESYRDDTRRSDMIRVLDRRGEKVFKDFGFLLKGLLL